jgi:oligopeptide/dipeptide ABC transporter ATP-binding protein
MSLLRLLGPVAEITARAITLAGHDFLNASEKELRSYRRDLIGTVFQDPTANWNPTRQIGAQVLQPFPKVEHDQRRAELISFMERVGIDRAAQRVDQYPHNLSGGMLQRAMIAGALLGNPQLLVADEPTSALDVTVQADLIQLLKELTIERSLSMLLISHNLLVVSQIASHVIVMYSGNVIEEGETAEVLRSPKHPYTINLISSIPSLHKKRKVPLYTAVSRGSASRGCPYLHRCPISIEICKNENPVLKSVAGRKVACHRAEESNQLIEATT